MHYENMGKLIDRWIEDKNFRKEMRLNAERAIRQAGIPLTPEEWTVLSNNVDWTLSDNDLQARLNKGM